MYRIAVIIAVDCKTELGLQFDIIISSSCLVDCITCYCKLRNFSLGFITLLNVQQFGAEVRYPL